MVTCCCYRVQRFAGWLKDSNRVEIVWPQQWNQLYTSCDLSTPSLVPQPSCKLYNAMCMHIAYVTRYEIRDQISFSKIYSSPLENRVLIPIGLCVHHYILHEANNMLPDLGKPSVWDFFVKIEFWYKLYYRAICQVWGRSRASLGN